MVKYLKNKSEFDEALKSAGDKLVVVDFTASWCGPCRMMAPKFEAFSTEHTDVYFYKVDVDDNDETAANQNVSAMPTFKFYKNGIEIAEVVGASEVKLAEEIKKNK